jgi:hypothetical protein
MSARPATASTATSAAAYDAASTQIALDRTLKFFAATLA